MLFLVHVRLAPHPDGTSLPLNAASALADTDPTGTVILHVSAHPCERPGPVIGVYVESAARELAESTARVAWWAAVGAQPQLGGWELISASVALAPDSV